jgi:hypothetical protein
VPNDFGRRGLPIDLQARKNLENFMAAVFIVGSVEARTFVSGGGVKVPYRSDLADEIVVLSRIY